MTESNFLILVLYGDSNNSINIIYVHSGLNTDNNDFNDGVSNDFESQKSSEDYFNQNNWPWEVHQMESTDEDYDGDQKQAFPIFVEEVFPVDPKPTQISSSAGGDSNNENDEDKQRPRPVTNSPIIWIRQNPQIAEVKPVPTPSNADFSLLSHEVIDLTGNFKETKVVPDSKG